MFTLQNLLDDLENEYPIEASPSIVEFLSSKIPLVLESTRLEKRTPNQKVSYLAHMDRGFNQACDDQQALINQVLHP